MNVFDCAIKMEEEARMYYETLASAAATKELKNLFTTLAHAEKEHHDALVEMKEGTNTGKFPFRSMQDAVCLFKPLLAKRTLIAELKKSPDAYQLVVAQEQKGIDFYAALALKTDDEGHRQILNEIAEEERRHLNIVENIYSFVESPKSFLAWGEFSNLKEY